MPCQDDARDEKILARFRTARAKRKAEATERAARESDEECVARIKADTARREAEEARSDAQELTLEWKASEALFWFARVLEAHLDRLKERGPGLGKTARATRLTQWRAEDLACQLQEVACSSQPATEGDLTWIMRGFEKLFWAYSNMKEVAERDVYRAQDAKLNEIPELGQCREFDESKELHDARFGVALVSVAFQHGLTGEWSTECMWQHVRDGREECRVAAASLWGSEL